MEYSRGQVPHPNCLHSGICLQIDRLRRGNVPTLSPPVLQPMSRKCLPWNVAFQRTIQVTAILNTVCTCSTTSEEAHEEAQYIDSRSRNAGTWPCQPWHSLPNRTTPSSTAKVPCLSCSRTSDGLPRWLQEKPHLTPRWRRKVPVWRPI